MTFKTIEAYVQQSSKQLYCWTALITFATAALWEVNRSARYFTLFAGARLIVSPFYNWFYALAQHGSQ
jgi:hypothetical protein